MTAPCDFAIAGKSGELQIISCAKGFNSTGSKLTDAVREVQEMAEMRMSHQWLLAIIDGIGWLSRQSDLRRIYDLRAENRIDGLYTLSRFDEFRGDIAHHARLQGLLP